MSTSLSRHLFRLDEVAAALRYSIVNRRIEEGMFWTLELIDSEEIELLFDVLFESWVFTVGAKRFALLTGFIKTAQKIVSSPVDAANSLLLLSFSLLKLPSTCSDGSIAAIPILVNENIRQNEITMRMHKLTIDNVMNDDEFLQIIRRGNALKAALHRRLSGAAAAATIPIYLKERAEMQLLIRQLPSICMRCRGPAWPQILETMEILVLCMTDADWAESIMELPAELSAGMQECIEGWRALTGRRARRIFEVPKWCLKWQTARGRTYYARRGEPFITNVAELREPWHAMGGCRFWDRMAAAYGCIVNGRHIYGATEDAWEAFVNAAFPDDIPDEWSLEAQLMSHGEGTVAPGGSPSAIQWLRSWFPTRSIAVPSPLAKVDAILANRTFRGVFIDEWMAELSLTDSP